MPDQLTTSRRAGRLGRTQFTLATIVLVAAAIATGYAALRLQVNEIAFLFCPLVIGWLIVVALRLRDMGLSVRWLLFPTLAAPAATVVVAVIGNVVLIEAGLDDLGPLVFGFMIGLAFGAVLWLAFMVWLAVTPTAAAGDKGAAVK